MKFLVILILPPACMPALINEIFLICVNDCLEDMTTLTALAKIYSSEYFHITNFAEPGEIFCPGNFFWAIE